MRKVEWVIPTSVTLIFLLVQNASANWYAGSRLSSVYGVWAYIQTPSVAPFRVAQPNSGQYNWVSTPGPNWIQTGWAYISGFHTVPWQYIETCINNCFGPPPRYYQEFDTQPWGTTIDYMIEYFQGPQGPQETLDTWCAYIGGVQKRCQSIRTAPSDIEVMSEILVSPFNQLDTIFNPVYYKDSTGVWQVFNQNTFSADFPYQVQVITNWHFHTFRVSTFEIYLPLILR